MQAIHRTLTLAATAALLAFGAALAHASDSQPEAQPNPDSSTSEEQKPADGEPQLNFSTEGEKK